MTLWPVVLLMVLYFSGLPIAFALIASSLAYFTFVDTGMPVDLLIQDFIKYTSSFPLLAVPFFILAGEVMNYSGISANLMRLADALTGHLRGGLAQVNVVLSTLMGGISGSANADAAMQSKILVPEMEKRGYDRSFSAAITAASSSISPVIPPGINLIIYALIANVSVGKIFIAGYVPGILMAACLMLAVAIISRRRNYKPMREKMCSPKEIGSQFLRSSWALMIPFGVIMGLRFGWFTPTEAGAMAVLMCTLIGFFVYRQLRLDHWPIILRNTIYSSSSVILIIVAASIFGSYMSWEGIPRAITQILKDLTDNPYAMLAMINALLLVLGMFIEGGALLIIVAPLLVPVVVSMGVDPIHFGLIMIVNIMIGGVTPPFGSMMFTTCSITKVPVMDFVREIMPMIAALVVALLAITYIPAIVLFLPNLLF
ncbi:TRAP transporter large permease [Gammaproteobacteria bacterium]|nr:TRAP transporter large permease [Gammaproteobacteria bacterium]